MIGIAKLHQGLYVIDTSDVSSSCNYLVSNSFKLWHNRLGHISNTGMHCMSKQLPLIPCNNNMNPCDSCYLEKLKKLPFPNSVTHTNAPLNSCMLTYGPL